MRLPKLMTMTFNQVTDSFDKSLSGSFVVIDSISDIDSGTVSDDPVNGALVKI